MVEKFKGNNPKNARIKIDYSGVKPKVTFSYPSKKYGQDRGMLPILYIMWWVILLIISFTIITNESINADSTEPTTNFSNYSECYACLMKEAETISDEICSEPTLSPLESLSNQLKDSFNLELLLGFLLAVVPPLLIYLPFKNFWANVYPKFMAGGNSNRKIAMFNPKDVKHSPEYGYSCEIPVFNNVVLDYYAKKDFSRYLKLFEIEEHKFKYYKPKDKNRKKKLTTRQKKERRKDMLNDNLWYARFYFSQKPKVGSLEVIFK